MANGTPSSVTVQFFGICTHFDRGSLPPERRGDWMQRAVLVNASNVALLERHPKLREKGVAPHIAELQMARRDLVGEPHATSWFRKRYEDSSVVQWKLDGVSLRIGNAASSVSTSIAEPIPSLSDYCDKPIPPLGRAAHEYDPGLTACFFDFPAAPVEGRIFAGGAVVSMITVSVDGPPAIEVTSFDGRTFLIPVKPGAQITVANIPNAPTSDKDPDFLLHFLALDTFPETARYPDKAFTGVQLHTHNAPRSLEGISGPGCSSSGYP